MGNISRSIKKKLDEHIIFDNKVYLSEREVNLMHRLNRMGHGKTLKISTQLGEFLVNPIYSSKSPENPSAYYVDNRRGLAAAAAVLGLALLGSSIYGSYKQHQVDKSISEKRDQMMLDSYLR